MTYPSLRSYLFKACGAGPLLIIRCIFIDELGTSASLVAWCPFALLCLALLCCAQFKPRSQNVALLQSVSIFVFLSRGCHSGSTSDHSPSRKVHWRTNGAQGADHRTLALNDKQSHPFGNLWRQFSYFVKSFVGA